MINTETNILFWGLIVLFTVFSLILACSSLANAVRLRNVRLNWKAGNMQGYPLFSSLFLGFAIIGVVIGFYHQAIIELMVSGLYLLMAAGWFVTSFLTSKRYITDHGIVKNVNNPSQTVAWYQIRDFVEKESRGRLEYVFIYSPESRRHGHNLVRLDLTVPSEHIHAFRKLIYHKLGRRLSCYTDEVLRAEKFD